MMKMTKVDYFKVLAGVVLDSDNKDKEMLVEFLDKEIGMLENRKNADTKKKREANEFAEKVYEALTNVEKAITISDLIKADETLTGFTPQKVSAAMKKLTAAERVKRTEVKGKTYFEVV